MPDRLTPEQIRTLAPEALTRLAWERGLDPHDPVGRRVFSWQRRDWGERAIDACGNYWRPHERIDQADALFRGLRTRGWWTEVHGGPDDGWCRASREEREIETVWPSQETGTEAHALLLCAVLAVASEGRP